MIIEDIRSACARVDALVLERDSDKFMWEDAIVELDIHPDMQPIVMALLTYKYELFLDHVCPEVQRFLG